MYRFICIHVLAKWKNLEKSGCKGIYGTRVPCEEEE